MAASRSREPRLERRARSRDTSAESSARPARRLAEPERDRRRPRPARPPRGPRPPRRAGCARRCCRAGRRRPAMLSTAKSSSTCPTASAVRLGDHLVVGGVGDGAAAGERGEPRAAPRRGARRFTRSRCRSAPRRPRRVATPSESMVDDGVEVAAREVAVGPGPPDTARRARPRRPVARRRLGDDLLREDVERACGGGATVSSAPGADGPRTSAAHSTSSSRRHAGRSGPSASRPASGRSGRRAAAPRASAPRRAELARPGRPCRCRCRARATRWRRWPGASPALSRSSASSRRARDRLPWCAATVPVAEPLAERVGDALGQPAGVDEDERGPVLPGQLGEPVVDLGPQLVRRHRRELVPRASRRPGRGRVRARRRRRRTRPLRDAPGRRRPGSGRPPRSALTVAERPMRCGRRVAERLEPLERERQVRCRACRGPRRGSRRR